MWGNCKVSPGSLAPAGAVRSAGPAVPFAAGGNGVGGSGAACAKMLVAAARLNVALQRSRCTVLFIMATMLLNSEWQVNLLRRPKRKSGYSNWTQRSVFYKKWPILQPLRRGSQRSDGKACKPHAYTHSKRIESTKILANSTILIAYVL